MISEECIHEIYKMNEDMIAEIWSFGPNHRILWKQVMEELERFWDRIRFKVMLYD